MSDNPILTNLRNLVGTINMEPQDEASVLLTLIRDGLIERSPKRTTALMQSIKLVGDDSLEVGGSTTHVKGYVKYAGATNNPWTSPRWHGKQNPNEGWVGATVLYYTSVFAQRYGYKVVTE